MLIEDSIYKWHSLREFFYSHTEEHSADYQLKKEEIFLTEKKTKRIYAQPVNTHLLEWPNRTIKCVFLIEQQSDGGLLP